MDVRIDEVVSTVRAVDDQALLSEEVMGALVRAVLEAVREEQAHDRRLADEQGINAGRDTSAYLD